jgi:hypothetical protein
MVIIPPQQNLTPILQLGSRLCQLLDLLELVEVLQAIRVQQRAARLDRLAREDLLDGKLNLLSVDGDLFPART